MSVKVTVKYSVVSLKKKQTWLEAQFRSVPVILPPTGLGRMVTSNSRAAWATGVRLCIRTTKTNLDLV